MSGNCTVVAKTIIKNQSHTKRCNTEYYNMPSVGEKITIAVRPTPRSQYRKKSGVVMYKGKNMFTIKFADKIESYMRADVIDGTIIIVKKEVTDENTSN